MVDVCCEEVGENTTDGVGHPAQRLEISRTSLRLKLGVCSHQSVSAHVAERRGEVGEEDEIFNSVRVAAVANKAKADEAEDSHESGNANPRSAVRPADRHAIRKDSI